MACALRVCAEPAHTEYHPSAGGAGKEACYLRAVLSMKAVLVLRCGCAQNGHTQNVIRVLVVLGVGMIMGDGVLTPAISVVSACEGLQQASAAITRSAPPPPPGRFISCLLFNSCWLHTSVKTCYKSKRLEVRGAGFQRDILAGHLMKQVALEACHKQRHLSS